MARYEEVRNRAQEPTSRTKKLVRNLKHKTGIAKEDQQDDRCLPAYRTGGGGPGPDRDGDGDPTDQDRDSSSEPGGNGFPSGKRRGGGGPPEDPRTQKMRMGYLEVSGDDEVPGVIQDPRDWRDRGGPKDRWDPGEYPGDYLPLVWGACSYHPQM